MTPRRVQLLLLAFLLLAWELVPRLGLVPPIILASLSETLAVPFTQASAFAKALLVTLGEILGALGIAWIGGGLIGIALGANRTLRRSALPLVASVYAVPFVVIYPILTAWMGIGVMSKIWFGGIYGFFPMALASAAGVQTIDPRHLIAARAMGATRWQLLREIYIPAALPAIVSGLRLGGALATIGVIVAEMMAATKGLGFLITQSRTLFRTPEVYFGILLVLLLVLVLDTLIRMIESRVRGTERQSAR